MKPGSGANKHSTDKPAGTVVTNGCA
jgi:hypothetical protein